MPRTGKEFVAQLKSQLTVLAAEVDAGFPANSELTIDADGVPHLKKQPAGSQPAGLAAFESRSAGPGDPGAQVIAHDLSWNAADGRQHVDVCRNPVRQRLCPGGLRKDVAGSTEHGDEDLDALYFPGGPVDHLHGVTGEVYEDPLARCVHLPQRRFQTADPCSVQVTEL